MAVIDEITLDVLRPTQYVVLRLQQGDAITRKINITVTEGNEIYTIPASSLLSLRMVKPDGNPIFNSCVLTNNKAQFTITPEMSSISGRCAAQLQITDSLTAGVLKTVKFHILIDEGVIPDTSIESTGEFTALQDALLEVGDITNKISKSMIADNLITDDPNFVLSAKQGKELNNNLTKKANMPVYNMFIEANVPYKVTMSDGPGAWNCILSVSAWNPNELGVYVISGYIPGHVYVKELTNNTSSSIVVTPGADYNGFSVLNLLVPANISILMLGYDVGVAPVVTST